MMGYKAYFPKIIMKALSDGFIASAGLELNSVLKMDLLYPASNIMETFKKDFLEQKAFQKLREGLLTAIAAWPSTVSLELHMVSLPDLTHRARGKIFINLFLNVKGDSKESAREELLARYIALVSLLPAYWPEAEFIPVANHKKLKLLREPFTATHALAIMRIKEDVPLAELLPGAHAGFGMRPAGEEQKHSIRHTFPWTASLDDWRALENTMVHQLDPVKLVFRIRAKLMDKEMARQTAAQLRACEDFLSREKKSQITMNKQIGLIRDILLARFASRTERCFDVGVFITAQHAVDTSLGSVLGHAITSGRGLFVGGFACSEIAIDDAEDRFYFPEQDSFLPQEAACAFRLPSPPMYDVQYLPVKRSRTLHAALPASSDTGSITLFLNHHHGIEQPVCVGAEDRMRHTFVAGATGTGKTKMVKSWILQDLRMGRGVGVIDPHDELVDEILAEIPPSRAKDVILFNLLDHDRPIGFNILEWNDIYERDLIIDELYSSIEHLYANVNCLGPIYESNMRGVLKIIMGDHKRKGFTATLLDFLTFYQNEDFRNYLMQDITDPDSIEFIHELENTGGEASLRNLSPYITSKFSRFTNDITLKRIIGQEKSALDFDDIINNGKILLIKLGKGRFGNNVSALITNMIVGRFRLAAMKRGNIPPEQRRSFFLYVDECSNLPSEHFMELMSEARKFRLGLVLITQFTRQLKKPSLTGNTLLEAILANVATIALFRLGTDDARDLAGVLYPLTAEDILGLSNREGYVKMQLKGETLPAFSFKTIRDTAGYNEENAKKIINASRLRYGVDCHRVDADILKRHSCFSLKKECA